MVSYPELGSDPPIGSDRESGCDNDSLLDMKVSAKRNSLTDVFQ